MRFDVRPFEGALPIRFGMLREDVHRLLGSPANHFQHTHMPGSCDLFPKVGCNVGYDASGVVTEVVVLPKADGLTIDGRAVWGMGVVTDPNFGLLDLDPAPVAAVGSWFFLRLGVSTCGFHDDDLSQAAVHVWPRGGYDEVIEDAEPADTAKYRVG